MKKGYILIIGILALLLYFPIDVFASNVIISPPEGDDFNLEVELTDKVSDVKSDIESVLAYKVDNQILKFAGDIMDDDKTLEDYNVIDSSVIMLDIKNVYKKYDIGSVIYFNPYTASLCTNGSANCYAWGVYQNDSKYSNKINLLMKDSIGSTLFAKPDTRTITEGCFKGEKYFYLSKEDCGTTTESSGATWQEGINKEIVLYDNIEGILEFLDAKTSSWNSKLTLTKSYDGVDLSSYKARLFTVDELSSMIGMSNKYLPLFDEERLGDVNYLNNPIYLYSLKTSGDRIQAIMPFKSVIISTTSPTNSSSEISPIIEVKKDYFGFALHDVTIDSIVNGSVSTDVSKQYYGDLVEITITPDEDYELDTVTVTDTFGNTITVTNNKFVMPDSDVNISVTFKHKPLTVTFDTNGGTDIATQSVDYDNVVEKPETPEKEGYTFVNWYDDNTFTSIYDFETKIKLDTMLYAKWNEILPVQGPEEDETKDEESPIEETQNEIKPIEYIFLSGGNQVLDIDSDDLLTFRVNIDLDEFLASGGIYIDGIFIDPSNYTTEKGSTIITFNPEFIKNLSLNLHSLKVEVAAGNTSTNFTLTKVGTLPESPNTVDNVKLHIVILSISLIGLISTSVYFKKYLLKG